MALAGRLDKQDFYVYVIIGDGELSEGQVWEAAMASASYKLGHVIAFIDNNGLQAMGKIEDRLNTGPYAQKFQAFGWDTYEINGHSVPEILDAVDKAKKTDKPSAIIAHTVKGKGFSFAENVVGFHHNAMDQAQYEQALKELS